jgi:hypothetical protein
VRCLRLSPRTIDSLERTARLKQGRGVDVTEAQCGTCHGLDYVVINSPFPGPAQWEAEVAKMLGDYLKQNYGG